MSLFFIYFSQAKGKMIKCDAAKYFSYPIAAHPVAIHLSPCRNQATNRKKKCSAHGEH